jgi:hypothetical protein
LSVTAGALRVIPDGSSAATSVLSSVSVTGGQFDLTNNKLIVNGSSLATVSNLVKLGRNSGSWNGIGIVTSQSDAIGASSFTTLGVAMASDIAKITFGGQSVNGGDVLVMYTYAGDADLSGRITGDDYFRIDQDFTSSLSGYSNGDFNYDNKINADDYFIIDRNYSRQGLPFSAAPALAQVTAVPEPASIGVILVGIGVIGSRQRTRSRKCRTSTSDS